MRSEIGASDRLPGFDTRVVDGAIQVRLPGAG
jgi:hypothetical protein